MLPSTYRPHKIEDFVGPARAKAEFITRLVTLAQDTGDPIRLLILGKPGIGKSALAEFFVRTTGASQWSVSKFNGTSFRIDDVERLAGDLHLTDMFGGYRVVRIEEVDKVPTVAQVRMLTLLDDLPPRTAVVATSNCRVSEFEVRFQRRFTVIELEPPTDQDILGLFKAKWPQMRPAAANMISMSACGNLGQALNDADAELAA